mmetsp:Transcript_3974/g.12387  ORF Transcript_3974/g.12387 Transcript_3974/m.12387 type:complete len:217 (+) Transcript_3974:486-1136(+)
MRRGEAVEVDVQFEPVAGHHPTVVDVLEHASRQVAEIRQRRVDHVVREVGERRLPDARVEQAVVVLAVGDREDGDAVDRGRSVVDAVRAERVAERLAVVRHDHDLVDGLHQVLPRVERRVQSVHPRPLELVLAKKILVNNALVLNRELAAVLHVVRAAPGPHGGLELGVVVSHEPHVGENVRGEAPARHDHVRDRPRRRWARLAGDGALGRAVDDD